MGEVVRRAYGQRAHTVTGGVAQKLAEGISVGTPARAWLRTIYDDMPRDSGATSWPKILLDYLELGQDKLTIARCRLEVSGPRTGLEYCPMEVLAKIG